VNLRNLPRNAALLVPLLLVNGVAVYGQSGWAYENLHLGGWIVAIGFALAVESIGVYLSAEAHAAKMAGHSAGMLQLGAYGVGLLSGALNYAHFAGANLRATPLAMAFAALSALSPILWGIRSRSMNRERLYAAGLIDPRAVKFSRLRWILFPARTFRAFRYAVWNGIQSPAEAVTGEEAARAARTAGLEARTVQAEVVEAEPLEAVEPELPRPERLRLAAVPTVAPSRAVTRVRRTAGAGRQNHSRIFELADAERGTDEIANELGVSRRTVQRVLQTREA